MGTLFVVATPIGNLEDISARALRVLGSVRAVAAEDTRHTRRLLSHYGIATPLVSYHAHSGARREAEILELLEEGDVALVTDAGTPAVSDPGQGLVDAVLRAGHTVSPVPGPSALTAAVSASGLVPGPFVFVGFLPRKQGERRRQIEQFGAHGLPLVLYEAANRTEATLHDLACVLGDREAAVLRELTKLHEEVRRGTLTELAVWARAAAPRGEVVMVVGGGSPVESEPLDDAATIRLLAELRASGLTASAAAREAAARTGRSRSEVYALGKGPAQGVGEGA